MVVVEPRLEALAARRLLGARAGPEGWGSGQGTGRGQDATLDTMGSFTGSGGHQ